jgi:hypothetical protein
MIRYAERSARHHGAKGAKHLIAPEVPAIRVLKLKGVDARKCRST